MKTHSQAFKENISLLGKQQEIKITYQENNEEKVLTGEQINSASPHYEGNLLKSVMKELDLDSNVDISPETEVNFQYGIAVVDKDLNYKEKEGNPITCENAINEKIRNLVVNGKSEQSSTLPEGYTQVEYIESTGTQYIDIGFNGGNNYTIKCKIQDVGRTTFVFSDYKDNVANENLGLYVLGSGTYGIYYTSTQKFLSSTAGDIKNIDFALNSTGLTYTINEETGTSSYTPTTNNGNVVLFRRGNSDTYYSSTKLYNFKIFNGSNTLVRNLIPCYRNSDNVIGMYDLVNDVFYTNAGTGTFLKGNDVSIPSPDYPSDIHSVADDVNLLNLQDIENHNVNFYYENITTDFQLEAGQTYTLSFDAESTVTPFNVGIGCGSSGNYQSDILNKHGFQNGRISITFTPQNSNFTYGNYLALRFVRYNSSTSYTYSARNIKLQKGTEATPYSPYNQGTVTIKQENIKNYLNWDKFIDYSNWTNSNSPGYKSFEITGLNINKTYTLCRTDTAGYGETSKYAGFNKGNNNGNMFLHSTDSSRNLQSVSDTPSEDGKIYITMYMSSQSDLNDYINIIKKCWVIEGTEYQEYVNNNYIIQTEPLRSLPNGVKDTIEADGIHRRVGKVVLDGSDDENWELWSGGTNTIGFKISNIANFKNIQSSSTENIVLSNYFKKKTNQDRLTRDDEEGFATAVGNLYFKINRTILNSLADWKTWLSNNPTEVIYELAEEIIEPFTEEQEETLLNIKTEVGTNIFTITNDLLPTFSLDYAISSQNYDYAHHLIEYEYLNFGNYIVFSSEKQEDTYSYKIKCYDKMLYSMKPYQNINITYPITIRNYITTLCNHLNLVFANSNNTFTNYDKQIPNELYLDNEGNDLGYTFRDVLDELAQVTGSVICINNEDKIEIRYPNETNDTIDEEYLKDVNVNFGESYGAINTVILSRSAGADKISMSNPANLPDNEKVAIEISDNQIMNFNNRNEYLSSLLTRLYGTQYYLNDFTSTGIAYYDLLDRYNVRIGENIYNCLMLNDELNITQGLEEIIHSERPEESETDYTKTDTTDRRINQTYLIVDKQNQRIDSVITNVTEQNNKISQITQTVDELNSKISNIADITIAGESMIAVVQLDNINQSEPIEIRVRPITENISYLYPRNNLYPSNNLFMKERKIRFVRTYEEEGETKTENIDYEIPDDLLYYDSNTYDEFYLNYNSETCQIIKKCKYNADGTVGLLSMAETTDYEYPHILLDDGNYTIQLLGYNIGYLSVRLMAQNIYTTQFATKAELSSSITQTANEINLRVDEKLDEEDFTSANIMLKINNDESEASINADKINLNGVVTANNNFKILSDGSMEAVNGTFKNGKILLSAASQGANIFKIQKTGDNNTFLQLGFNLLQLDYAGSTLITLGRGEVSGSSVGSISLSGRGYTSLQSDGIITPKVTQTSLEKDKKNISKYNKSALNEIKNIDIYTYNLKTELDTDKKHIGFIIGENYNYSKDVVDYDSGQNEIGVDNYSFVSLCCKAIQEQQKIIENLQNQINELKGEK